MIILSFAANTWTALDHMQESEVCELNLGFLLPGKVKIVDAPLLALAVVDLLLLTHVAVRVSQQSTFQW